jgi:hypothetical protein
VAEARLAELRSAAPPRWARAVVAPELDARGTTVLYAPDWRRPAVWQPVVRAWAEVFGDADDVTLVLAAPPGERDALAPQVLACLERPRASAPDVLLDATPGGRLDGLVAACDAVLLDDATHAGPAHELLTRRASRTLAADAPGLAAFAAQLHAHAHPHTAAA